MTTHGLTPYSGPKAGRPGPRDVLALIQEKCRLRALMEEQQAKIDAALPHAGVVEPDGRREQR